MMSSKFLPFVRRMPALLSLVVACHVQSQTSIVVKGDTLIMESGAKCWIGEELTLGKGSAIDNSFVYVYESPLAFKNVLNRKKKPAPIPTLYAGHTCMVKKFGKDANYKNSYSFNILVLQFIDGKTYWCDVDNALKANELASRPEGTAQPPAVNKPVPKKTDQPKTAPNIF